jgi:hypothetical protein
VEDWRRPVSDQPSPKPYGRLKLYALSSRGLHRTTGANGWQLVREFDPISLVRVLEAAERMPEERMGYVLWLLDSTLRNERDRYSERWAWELITESEGVPIVSTFNRPPRRRARG